MTDNKWAKNKKMKIVWKGGVSLPCLGKIIKNKMFRGKE